MGYFCAISCALPLYLFLEFQSAAYLEQHLVLGHGNYLFDCKAEDALVKVHEIWCVLKQVYEVVQLGEPVRKLVRVSNGGRLFL